METRWLEYKWVDLHISFYTSNYVHVTQHLDSNFWSNISQYRRFFLQQHMNGAFLYIIQLWYQIKTVFILTKPGNVGCSYSPTLNATNVILSFKHLLNNVFLQIPRGNNIVKNYLVFSLSCDISGRQTCYWHLKKKVCNK